MWDHKTTVGKNVKGDFPFSRLGRKAIPIAMVSMSVRATATFGEWRFHPDCQCRQPGGKAELSTVHEIGIQTDPIWFKQVDEDKHISCRHWYVQDFPVHCIYKLEWRELQTATENHEKKSYALNSPVGWAFLASWKGAFTSFGHARRWIALGRGFRHTVPHAKNQKCSHALKGLCFEGIWFSHLLLSKYFQVNHRCWIWQGVKKRC